MDIPGLDFILERGFKGATRLIKGKQSFKRTFYKCLKKHLRKEEGLRKRETKRIIKIIKADLESLNWFKVSQLPKFYELSETLIEKHKFSFQSVEIFYKSFVSAIISNDELSELIKRHNDFNESQAFPGEDDNIRKSKILLKYCHKVFKEFGTIFLFGKKSSSQDIKVNDRVKGMDSGFIPLSFFSSREDLHTFEIYNILSDDSKKLFLISGLPGSGKTTLLRYLAFRSSQKSIQKQEEIIPVYIRLKNFNRKKSSLIKFIEWAIDRSLEKFSDLEIFTEKDTFLGNSMVLLLDGVDEIEDQSTNNTFHEELGKLTKKYPRCRIIVTSRPINLDPANYQNFEYLRVKPLEKELIHKYINEWFFDHKEKASLLINTLNKSPRILSLAENPFLLSMICFTFEQSGDSALIERRSDLYHNCIRFLLGRLYDPEFGKLEEKNFEEALNILKDLSLRFFLWQESHFPVDHVNVFGKRIITPNIIGKTSKFLERVQRDTGIIQNSSEGFTFTHRSLWEYFTALSLLEKDIDFVICQAGNPHWEEVIRLFAGLLDSEEEIQRLINGLWNINRPLALRTTTEIKISSAELIGSLVSLEGGNQAKLMLINSLEASLPLIHESMQKMLIHETLNILLKTLNEKDCEVIYHAHELLEREELHPLEPGGLIYDLFDLGNSEERLAKLEKDQASKLEWVKVDGGTFWMGQEDTYFNEVPLHAVHIDTFEISKHPVTNRLFSIFPFKNSEIPDDKDNLPVAGRTWYEAYYFSLFLNSSLPTESEWEYAVRGGQQAVRTRYFFGDESDKLENYAWFGEPKRKEAYAVDEINPKTGETNLNRLGIANMLGNVWEWCLDNYYEYKDIAWDKKLIKNPIAPKQNEARIFRGGTYKGSKDTARCARRVFSHPTNTGSTVGFRLVRRSSELNPLS
ncbi:MAG: SUMF1/EgtB/PvdO family nonheme iron enzyme [Bacteroidia bacterium]|nr:SUMF1/EgtB/PvdO family nonheme iron enzyme [Bacteroidia bacterium]